MKAPAGATTVIVVSYRTPTLDLGWIPEGTEVFVVTNDSTTPAVAGATTPTVLDPGWNLGFGAGVNLAAASATGRRLLVVNPDAALTREHWEALTDAADDEVVTVPLAAPSGVRAPVVSAYPGAVQTLFGAWRLRHRLRGRVPTSLLDSRIDHVAGSFDLASHWFSGAVFSVDRARFLAVDGFDERYFLYWEDVDLSRRLSQRYPGMTVRVPTVAPAVHRVGGSAAGLTPSVELERLLSAARYAASGAGLGFRLSRALIDRKILAVQADRLVGPRPEVLVLSLGRAKASGERRRVRSWQALAAAAGMESRVVCLPRRGVLAMLGAAVVGWPTVLAGRRVPECLVWSPSATVRLIREAAPSVVVCVTARAYAPELDAGGAPIILDFVDRLSVSYRERAEVLGRSSPRRRLLQALAARHRAFEAISHPCATSAAGRADAEALGAEFVPIVRDHLHPVPGSRSGATDPDVAATHDLVFVGTLDYLPNVDAVRALDRMWPDLVAGKRDVSLLVAGARPGPDVIALCEERRWSLRSDFEDLRDVYAAARLAVVPVSIASGMQIKVQDAMSHGRAVVSFPPAVAGYPTHIPVTVASDERRFVAACLSLLDDRDARVAQEQAGMRWVAESLAPARWTGVFERAQRIGTLR